MQLPHHHEAELIYQLEKSNLECVFVDWEVEPEPRQRKVTNKPGMSLQLLQQSASPSTLVSRTPILETRENNIMEVANYLHMMSMIIVIEDDKLSKSCKYWLIDTNVCNAWKIN